MRTIDEHILDWINGFVGNSVLDRIMVLFANDFFIPVTISLILLAVWFMGRDKAEREAYQRALIITFTAMGSVCGFVLAVNHLYYQPHPFEPGAMPELLDSTVHRIFYPIVDPTFPSNTSAVTFAAFAGLWQVNRKLGLIMLIPATLMPLAKVYAAVYWPSDIVVGAILGILTAYFIRWIMPVFEPFLSRAFKLFRKLCLA